MRVEKIQTGGSITYDDQDIGSFIAFIGKCSGVKSNVLDDTITTLLQMHGRSLSNIMVSVTTGKADFLINTCNYFT